MVCKRCWENVTYIWQALQVQLHGKYSVERMHNLQVYTSNKSLSHVIFIIFATPLPTLALVTILDVIPLESPKEGSQYAYMHWLRLTLMSWFTAISLYEQARRQVVRLPISTTQIMVLAVIIAVAHGGICYGYALVIGFPLPFTLALALPDFTLLTLLCLVVICGKFLMHNLDVARDLFLFVITLGAQASLLIVYPVFTFFFIKLGASYQMLLFMLFFPALKLAYMNWLSHLFRHLEDIRPENVVFIIEIFHSLFVACSLQMSPSIHTTLFLMVIDIGRLGLSIRGMSRRLRKLNRGNTNEATKGLLLPFSTVMYILEQSEHVRYSSTFRYQSSPRHSVEIPSARAVIGLNKQNNRSHCRISTTRVSPFTPSLTSGYQVQDVTPRSLSITLALSNELKIMIDCMSDDEKLDRVQSTLQMFYWIEFTLLTEFAEVLIPFTYSASTFIVYHLPNRTYYSQFDNINDAELHTSIGRIILFSSMKLLSFILLCVVFRWKLGISPLHHLAFVLENQRQLVQAKLAIWVVFVMQNTFEHFGVDYTFQFKWLEQHK